MDDNDKIRRNLVVTSTVVIAIAWLDIPIPLLIDRLTSLKTANGFEIGPWKIWALVLVVLSYFAWRYRWSEEFTKGWLEHSKAAHNKYGELLQQHYVPLVAGWSLQGNFPPDAHPKLQAAMNHAMGIGFQDGLVKPTSVLILVGENANELIDSPAANVTTTWPDDDEKPLQNNYRNKGVTLFIDGARRHAYIRNARNYAHLNSKATMALFFPLGLGCVAGCIVLFRFVRSIFGQ